MECPTCGAALLPSAQECVRCAEKIARAPTPSIDSSEAPAAAKRPFAQITPFSGPYPPPYVQISSSESQPGPINILAKWIGILWTAVVPTCIALTYSSSRTDPMGSTGNAGWVGLSIPGWIGLWAIIVVPAYLIYRSTRPKSSRILRP